MIKRNVANVIVLILPIVYILLYMFVIFGKYLEYIEFINASFMILLFFISVLLFGFCKNRINQLKKNVNIFIILCLFAYFLITYAFGLFIGFLTNSYSLELKNIVNNIFAPIILIIFTELFRYNFLRANNGKKKLVILLNISLIIFESFISFRLSSLVNLASTFRVGTMIIIPIIVKNCMLTYLSKNVGYQTTIMYRLVMDTYMYVVPIIPDLGDYINSIAGILIPFIIFYFSSNMIRNYYEGVSFEFGDSFGLTDVVIVTSLVCFALLVTRKLPWYMLGIASESMVPNIKKGDAVIIKKNVGKIEKGNVVAFINQDGIEIVHRIVDEDKNENNEKCYVTKGDASNNIDPVCVKEEDILGKVILNVPRIAYPRVIINELFSKE